MPEIALVALRSLLAFSSLLVFVLFMRNKQLSQFTFMDYVVGITIGSMASTLSVELENRTLSVWMGLLVWGTVPVFLGWLYLKSQIIRRTLESGPSIVIKNGKILEENLKKEQVTLEDLQMLLRGQGVFDLNDVEYAVLEKNGQVSVLKKREKQPLTAADLGVTPVRMGAPLVLVSDGKLLDKTLAISPYDEDWLRAQLAKRGITDISQVVLAHVDTLGNFYVDIRSDDGPDVPQLSKTQQVLVNLEQAMATLTTFSLETEEPVARDRYQRLLAKVKELQARLNPYLQS